MKKLIIIILFIFMIPNMVFAESTEDSETENVQTDEEIMDSIQEEFNISDYYADIIYNQYLELEKELVTHIREFYNRVYDSLESYDNKIEEMTTLKEEK